MITQLDDTTPSWSVRLISALNAADDRATVLVRGLTREQLNWTPAPGVWSVGQCIEHLCVANEVYLGAMWNSLGGPHAAVQEIQSGWFGRWFIRNYIEPSTQTPRRRAPKKIRPGAQIETSILDRFIRSNDKARDFVRRAAAYDVNRIRFRNPFIPLIHFTVGTGLDILSKHQQRHLLQAERIRAKLQ